MYDLYDRIIQLCNDKNENITTMCTDAKVSRASLSDLKMGRKKALAAETLSKIAGHFGVPMDFLTGTPPFDQWDLIKSDRKTAQKEMWFSDALLLEKFGIKDIDAMTLAQYINFIDTVVVGIEPKENNEYDLKVKPPLSHQKKETPEPLSSGVFLVLSVICGIFDFKKLHLRGTIFPCQKHF